MPKGKLQFADKYCKGCSLCVAACPKKILKLGQRTNAKGYNVVECFKPEDCTGCAACATMCPDCVITVEVE